MKSDKIVKHTKIELLDLVDALAWNDSFGCYTRPGFEKLIWPEIADQASWIIYFDIDNMHDLNSQHTHDGVDAMIKKSLAMRETDYVAGQWKSGDEFVICITEDGSREEASDPNLLCERLWANFLENGLPATFGITRVTSKNLIENVKSATAIVELAKKENRRGRIYKATDTGS